LRVARKQSPRYKPAVFPSTSTAGVARPARPGELRIEMQSCRIFMSPVTFATAPVSTGKPCRCISKAIASPIARYDVDQALEKFSAFPHMMNKLKLLQEVAWLCQDWPAGNTLSAVKPAGQLAKELSRAPPAALSTCSTSFRRFACGRCPQTDRGLAAPVDAGNSVLIIEHNLNHQGADWIIDLVPRAATGAANSLPRAPRAAHGSSAPTPCLPQRPYEEVICHCEPFLAIA